MKTTVSWPAIMAVMLVAGSVSLAVFAGYENDAMSLGQSGVMGLWALTFAMLSLRP